MCTSKVEITRNNKTRVSIKINNKKKTDFLKDSL